MALIHQITVIAPGQAPVTHNLDAFRKDCVRMGRGPFHGDPGAPENDIQVPDELLFVSRAQCSFRRDAQGSWVAEDDGSTNGMSCQNRKVQQRQLRDGDKLCIGQQTDESKRLVLVFTTAELEAPEQEMERFPLTSLRQCVIGRSPDCSIVVSHPTVSRQHCVITREKDEYYITDNHSLNGMLLNSVPLREKTRLSDMDRISIADVTFVYQEGILYYHRKKGGVGIAVDHLCKQVKAKGQSKTITDDVTLSIEPNRFVAILGGSGAGKTTLLKCMSGMTGFTSGEVTINGESIETGARSLRSLMGYVPQQDIVYDSLTLERMLYYSARLRMPQDTSPEEIAAKIDETLEAVELSAHRKTLISRLSGGERKRASIAVELLASPKLFFLDEPSSGLDPGTEKHLMQMLKRISQSGKTVVMVTHTVQNIELCDMLICMGRGGRLCFAGTPEEALTFFGKQSMTDIYDELNEHSEAAAERFRELSPAEPAASSVTAKSRSGKRRRRSVFTAVREFCVMTQRYCEILKNHPLRLCLLVGMPVLLTLLVCVAFQADGNIYNVLMRGAAFLRQQFNIRLYLNIERKNYPFLVASDTAHLLFAFTCAAFWTGIFNSIQELSKERPIYIRERFSGIGTLPYVLSKAVPLSLLCLIQSALMTAVLMLMTNTAATVDGDVSAVSSLAFRIPSDGVLLGGGRMWLELLLTTSLCVLGAMCLGLLISALASNEMAMVLCPVCLMPQILFSGVVGALTGITELISNFVICRWGCLAFCISSNVNKLYGSCAYGSGRYLPEKLGENGTPPILDAKYDLVRSFWLGLNNIQYAWLMMLLLSLVCVTAAVLFLHFRRSTSD